MAQYEKLYRKVGLHSAILEPRAWATGFYSCTEVCQLSFGLRAHTLGFVSHPYGPFYFLLSSIPDIYFPGRFSLPLLKAHQKQKKIKKRWGGYIEQLKFKLALEKRSPRNKTTAVIPI